jgi:feruloyl esterase
MWLLWTGKTQMPAPAPAQPVLSRSQREAITHRVLQACDANDGLADGQITHPPACRFQIAALGPQGDGTLTAAELQVAQRMYSGPQRKSGTPGGEPRYVGAQPGSEADWSPDFADNGRYGAFVGHAVFGLPSPPFDWRQRIDWDGVYDQVQATLTPVTAAPSPDLRRFAARGGKLIQTHGWNDSVVPPQGSTGYFLALTQWEALRHLPDTELDRRAAALTPAAVAAGANEWGPAVRQYHRLFMLPATSHCGGGTGPNAVGGGMPEPPAAWRKAEHHAVSAVMRWVEQGVAPDKIVATRFDGQGRPTRSRPLCAYPARAVYKGSGDIDDEANFECQPVALRAQDLSRGELATLRRALSQRRVLLPHR